MDADRLAYIRFLRRGNTLDYQEQRTRLTAAQADKQELEAEVLRGELLPKDTLEEILGRLIVAARSKLLAIPTAAAGVVGSMSEAEVCGYLEERIHRALNELAGGS